MQLINKNIPPLKRKTIPFIVREFGNKATVTQLRNVKLPDIVKFVSNNIECMVVVMANQECILNMGLCTINFKVMPHVFVDILPSGYRVNLNHGQIFFDTDMQGSTKIEQLFLNRRIPVEN